MFVRVHPFLSSINNDNVNANDNDSRNGKEEGKEEERALKDLVMETS